MNALEYWASAVWSPILLPMVLPVVKEARKGSCDSGVSRPNDCLRLFRVFAASTQDYASGILTVRKGPIAGPGAE